MKFKLVSLVTTLTLLLFCSLGCDKNSGENLKSQTNSESNSAIPTPTAVPDASLSFETGLVMKSGDVKPVARSTFYLLEKDLIEIVRAAGFKSKEGKPFTAGDLILAQSQAELDRMFDSKKPTTFDKIMEHLKTHSVATTTTDFGGKGQFSSLKPGTYYLMNISEIGNSHVVWNFKVDLKSGQNSATLDQNNAATAF